MLRSMALQRVGHDWVTEPNWTKDSLNGPRSWQRQRYTELNTAEGKISELEEVVEEITQKAAERKKY